MRSADDSLNIATKYPLGSPVNSNTTLTCVSGSTSVEIIGKREEPKLTDGHVRLEAGELRDLSRGSLRALAGESVEHRELLRGDRERVGLGLEQLDELPILRDQVDRDREIAGLGLEVAFEEERAVLGRLAPRNPRQYSGAGRLDVRGRRDVDVGAEVVSSPIDEAPDHDVSQFSECAARERSGPTTRLQSSAEFLGIARIEDQHRLAGDAAAQPDLNAHVSLPREDVLERVV
jgi:hypothetical protein